MPSTVTQALAAIMAELPSIGKADKSPEGYHYRGIEAITSRLQPLLAKHGVVIVPSATITNVVPSPAMRDGWQDIYMAVDWLIYGPAGDHVRATTSGIGRDRADKGANKAHTMAYKYLLLSLFAISDRNDDADAHDVSATDEMSKPAKRPSALSKRSKEPSDIGPSTADSKAALAAAFAAREDIDRTERLAYVRQTLGREHISGIDDLSADEVATIIAKLNAAHHTSTESGDSQ